MVGVSQGFEPSRLARILAVLLVLFCLSAPWSIAIAQTSIVMALLVVIAALVLRRLRFVPLPWTLLAVLLFLGMQVLSIPLGVHPERSLRCLRGSWVLLFPFLFWVALQSDSIRRSAYVALGISGALAGLYGIVQHFAGIDYLHGRALLENYGEGGFVAVGNLSSHLTYAGVLLPLVFLALGSALAARERRGRVLWSIAALLLGLAIVFSFTRSAWIGLAGGLVLFGLMLGRRPALLTLSALVLAGLLFAIAEGALAHRLVSIFDTSDPRWRLWETAILIWRDHPVTGAGLGSFKTLFPDYRVAGEYFSTIHPHSDVLNHLVEAGLLGALAWIGIWIAFFVETRNARGPLAHALRAGMGALLAAGLSQCYSTDEEVAQLWWMMAVLALYESGRTTHGGKAPFRQASKKFKQASLPLVARLLAPKNSTPVRPPRRILVVRQDNRLGNLLLMTPFLQRLRASFPEAQIGMVVGESYAELVRSWPWVDEWYVQPKREHARMPWRFPLWLRRMRAPGWDIAFEMSNHNTHSYFNCVLTLASGAPERIGFEEPRNRDVLTASAPPPAPELPFALAPLELLRPLGVSVSNPPSLACPMAPPSRALERFREQIPGPYGVVHLGGRGEKAWPLEAWGRLLVQLRQGYGGRLVLVAGPDELDRIPSEASRQEGIVRAPLFEIEDLAHLLAGADGYLGCDSGPMHLASAVGTRVVALFFRSNPYHYAPLGAEHTLVLLADPFGVDPESWNDGLDRARLVRAHAEGLEGRNGRPRTDDWAVARITEAVDSTWRGVKERSGTHLAATLQDRTRPS